MAPLRQWNGTAWLDVANEVVVADAEPVDPAVELWLDRDEPNTTGGLLDKVTADTDYVNVVGDTMSGPLVVTPPTLITHASRWADGIPRFATTAERDAAYLTIGGPVNGMQCQCAGFAQDYYNGTWASPVGGAVAANSSWAGPFPVGTTILPFQNLIFVYGIGWTHVGDGLVVGTPGSYLLTGYISLGWGADWTGMTAGSGMILSNGDIVTFALNAATYSLSFFILVNGATVVAAKTWFSSAAPTVTSANSNLSAIFTAR